MPKFNENVKLERVNINLPEKIVKQVKDYSTEKGIPYTQGYVILLNKALDETKALDVLTKALAEMKENSGKN